MHTSIKNEFFSWTSWQSSSCGSAVESPFAGLPNALFLIQSCMSNIFYTILINAVAAIFKITLSGQV